MSEKKKFRRHAWVEQFEKGEDGTYTYKGTVYVPGIAKETYAGLLRRVGVLIGCALVFAIAAGCIPESGMDGRAYIVLPYAVGVALTVVLTFRFGQVAMAGGRLYEHVYQKTVPRIPSYAGVAAALFAMSILGLVVDLMRGAPGGRPLSGALYAVLIAASAIALVFVLRGMRDMMWQAGEGDATNKG